MSQRFSILLSKDSLDRDDAEEISVDQARIQIYLEGDEIMTIWLDEHGYDLSITGKPDHIDAAREHPDGRPQMYYAFDEAAVNS